MLVLLLRTEDFETLDERQPGVDHHGELTREDGEVLGVDGLVLERSRGLRRLLLHRVDAGDEHLLTAQGHDSGFHRVRYTLTSDCFAAASPSTVCKDRHSRAPTCRSSAERDLSISLYRTECRRALGATADRVQHVFARRSNRGDAPC